MTPHRFRVRPCRCSMLDAQRSRWSPPSYGAHKSCTRTAAHKTQELKKQRSKQWQPNQITFQIGQTVRTKKSVVLCTHKPNLIVALCVGCAFSTFILLFIYLVRLHSDRNLMIFKNAHTNKMEYFSGTAAVATNNTQTSNIVVCDGT